jgi:hypothetical protein
MIMNRIRIIGIFILMLAFIAPEAALADWKIYYTGQMASMFGSAGRGNFATRSQCEAYRSSRPRSEQNGSYCSGFDTPSYTPPTPSGPSGDDGTAAREQEKQRQLQLQREQKERELEIARQKKFAEEKAQLLGTLKGTSTGTLGLKTRYEKGTHDSAPVDLRVLQEQDDFVKMNAAWMENQKKLIRQRLEEPNKWCSAIYTSLKTKAPPLPYKKFNELQPGDVLLIGTDGWGSKALNKADQVVSGDKVSNASHTVLYLKEINGKKLFLDDQPGEGPCIILEDEFLKRYGHRGTQVAKLAKFGVAQPLDEKEGDLLYAAAKEMAAKNREKVKANNWFDKTNYGAWNKENVVCSEADWALIKAADRKIPKSGDRIKKGLGIDLSPADFFSNEQYFLVSPLGMPK